MHLCKSSFGNDGLYTRPNDLRGRNGTKTKKKHEKEIEEGLFSGISNEKPVNDALRNFKDEEDISRKTYIVLPFKKM